MGQIQDGHFIKGSFYYQTEGFEKAIPEFEKSIEGDPHNFEAFNLLGECYYHQGFFDKAIRMFLESIKVSPDFVKAYMNLGLTYAQIGQYETANDYYKEAYLKRVGHS